MHQKKPEAARTARTPAEVKHHMCSIYSELGDVPVLLKTPHAPEGQEFPVQNRASVWAGKKDEELSEILARYPTKTAEIVPLFI